MSKYVERNKERDVITFGIKERGERRINKMKAKIGYFNSEIQEIESIINKPIKARKEK